MYYEAACKPHSKIQILGNKEPIQGCSDIYLEHLCIRHHGGVCAGDVKVALEELPKAAARSLRLIAAVHPRDVVPLDVAEAVQGHVAREGHRQIVAQAQNLPACGEAAEAAEHFERLSYRDATAAELIGHLA